jgi:hypothetical protein
VSGFSFLVLRIELEDALVGIDSLMVLLEHLKAVGLFKKSLDVIGLDFEGFFGKSFGLVEIDQFGEA